MTDDWTVDTGLIVKRQGGKLRLRRGENAQMQVARQLAAALMLPEPVRSDASKGVGAPVLQKNRYVVEHIVVDAATLKLDGSVVLRLGNLILQNNSIAAEEIRLTDRIELITAAWAAADEFPEAIARRLRAHKSSVYSGSTVTKGAEDLVSELQETVSAMSGDLGINYSYQLDVAEALKDSLKLQVPEPTLGIDEVDPEEAGVRLRIAKEWKRWANARGPKSAVFRERVRNAYRATCLVCGKRFPPTPISSPGVDAAHILPWSNYDLDQTFNGLCLCKLHHWAFDEMLIVIQHQDHRYAVEVAQGAAERLLMADAEFSVSTLQEDCGAIPPSRLPANMKDWPRPQLLEMLKSAVPGVP
ncbi:MAG: HNH endonuclease [Acidobacteriota bacterium]